MGVFKNYFKIVGLILFFSVFAYFTSFAEKGEKSGKRIFGAEEVYKIFTEGSCFFIDARSFKEYEKGHIEGALNIPFHSENRTDYIMKALNFLEGAEYVVVYCDGSDCGLSEMLAEDLLKAGLDNRKLVIFKEGFEVWKRKGYPVSKDLSFQKALFGQ